MKKLLLFVFLCITMASFGGNGMPDYTFKFNITGLKNVTCYLGYNFGDKRYLKDSARVNEKGEIIFQGKDSLKGGIYLFVFPNKTFFEFLVSETEHSFTIHADTSADPYAHIKVKGSKENTLWMEFLRHKTAKTKEIEALEAKRNSLAPGTEEYKKLDRQIAAIDEELKEYHRDKVKKNQGTFFANILQAVEEVEVPEMLNEADPAATELARFNYYKDHYFDYIDFSDHRLIRTPLIEGKLKYYLEKILTFPPDALIPEAEKMIGLASGNDEMRRYVTQQVTFYYANSNVMCMDKVFVHLADKYFIYGDAGKNMEESTYQKLVDKADALRDIVCGAPFPNVILQDTSEKVWHDVYGLDNEYTVVYFFDANCSHCKVSTPMLDSLNDAYLKPNNIGVIGIEGNLETDDWKKFVIEKNIKFLIISDNPELNKNAQEYIRQGKTTYESLNFRKTFDLYSFPVIFILDKDKKIIGKRMGVEQIKLLIEEFKKTGNH